MAGSRLSVVAMEDGLGEEIEGPLLEQAEDDPDDDDSSQVETAAVETDDSEQLAAAARSVGSLMYSSIVGMLVAVAWAYLLVQQVDPNNKCPKEHCWSLVVLLGLNTVAGIVYVPAASLAIMRRLSARSSGSAVFKTELQKRLQRLATDASASCYSCGASSFVFYLLKQLEFAASGGDPDSFVRPVAHAGSTAARRHLLHHRLAILLACLGICVGIVAVSFGTMLIATRRLATETRPFAIEVWLLLRSGFSYSCAYAVASFTGLLCFSPFDLGFGGEGVRFAAAAARAALFVFLALRLTRKLGPPPVDPAEASASWRACAHYLAFSVAAIVAAIGCHDVVTFVVLDLVNFTHWHQIAILFAYASALLGAVIAFRFQRRVVLDPTNQAFAEIFEQWLVCFAWWVPYKHVLVEVWDVFVAKRPPKSGAGLSLALYALRRIARLLWQLTVAFSLTLGFAALAALPPFAARFLHNLRLLLPTSFDMEEPRRSTATPNALLELASSS